jgi:hypothetical protein
MRGKCAKCKKEKKLNGRLCTECSKKVQEDNLGKKRARGGGSSNNNIERRLNCSVCNRLVGESDLNSRSVCSVCRQNKQNKKRTEQFKIKDLIKDKSSHNFKKIGSATRDYFTQYSYTGDLVGTGPISDETDFLRDLEEFLTDMTEITNVKVSLSIDFSVLTIPNHVAEREFSVTKTTDKVTVNNHNVKGAIKKMVEKVNDEMFEQSKYNDEKNSGIAFNKVNSVKLYINPVSIIRGGTFVDLPEKIKNIQACLNIKNNDNLCFMWCLVAFFHRKEGKKDTNPSKLCTYKNSKYISELNFRGVSFPVAICSIQEVEKLNNISINVYSLKETLMKKDSEVSEIIYVMNLIYPGDYNEERNVIEDRHINLLLYKGHYVLITNIRRLFSSCVEGKHTAYVCIWCGVSIFTTNKALENHEQKCKFKNKNQKYILPEARKLKFENYDRTIELPFIIYGDFESYFLKTEKKDTGKIFFEKEHKAMGFGIFTVCRSNSDYNKFYSYLGEDANEKFCNKLIEEIKRISDILTKPKAIIMTQEEEKKHNLAKKCFLCNREFKWGDKVRDHDHVSGKYRGAAHSICNLQFTKISYTIPIVFHNLEGYDLHLFIDELGKHAKDLNIIPKSKEKYLALIIKIPGYKIKVKFIDSLHYITGSLSSNAEKIKKFRFIDETNKDLQKKQVFPYSYFTDLSKLDELELPQNKKDWYNDLKDEEILNEDLEYAKEIYKKYKCKNLREYTELYLKTDVLLLAEIFETFRDLSMQTYGLDPGHYYSTPGLAWVRKSFIIF